MQKMENLYLICQESKKVICHLCIEKESKDIYDHFLEFSKGNGSWDDM